MNERDDGQLVEAAQAGDAEAFGQLYDRYVRKIHDYLFYRCHHRETAEDLTSQAFTKALERLASFDAAKGTFSAWIYRIARNTLIDHFRALKPETDIEDVWDLLRDGTDVARDAETAEKLRAVEAHLATLPSHQRELVIMRVWDGLTYAEIAEATGKSEASCKMAFSRTMSGLRKALPLAALVLLLAKPLS
jgi:RNA polymerase sigma-70 factor (ECF subfamily)